MKNKLYQEIYEELGNLAEFGQQESATNKILKIFQKQIDSINELKDEHNYSGDNEFIDGFSLGFDHAIKLMKKVIDYQEE